MKTRILAATILALVALSGLALPAAADGIIIPDPICPAQPALQTPCVDCVRPPISPCPPPPPLGSTPLAVKYHKVTATIENQVARTHVDQVFVNDSAYAMEGTYIFPLPLDATVSQFAMWVDGKKTEGRVLSRQEARSVYENIVRQRRDPALLEYLTRGAFQASIFPIPPGQERRVEIEYTQVLVAEHGLIHYVYPLSTEKFSARPLDSASVSVDIRSRDALKAVYSPSHPVGVERDGDYHARVGYEENRVKPDRDFELYYSVSQGDIGVNLLSFQPAGQDGFFLLLAAPKVQVDQRQVVSKDVLAVIDTSGSMDGEKIKQAQAALRYILDHLNPEDRFNVIRFSTGVESYAGGLRPAAERKQAQRFVDDIRAAGNTDINRALLQALAMADRERPTIVIFLTDGLPTTGVVDSAQIVANVKQAARGNVRLFSFGIGTDVNAVLLDMLSQDHRGAAAYVREGQRIDQEVSAFYAKVSTPVLADLKIDWGGVRVSEVYPEPLPDLFAGSQLVLVGRYRNGGPATIKLSGTVNGQSQTFTYADLTLQQSGSNAGADFIPRLWATRKIGYLLNQIRLRGESQETIAQIVQLAVRYGIATPYTSFLVDERAQTEAGRQQIIGAQATAMPKAASGGAAPGLSGGVGAAPIQAAQDQQQLRAAESIVAPQGDLAAQIRAVGDKTFILRKGVWTDAEFDPSKLTTVKVGVYGDDYFKLVAARPEWGQFFALGERVIVVLEGKAYEIVPGAGQAVPIPPAATLDPTRKPSPTVAATPTSRAANILPTATLAAAVTADSPTATPKPAPSGLCGGAAAMLAGAAAVLAIPRRNRRSP